MVARVLDDRSEGRADQNCRENRQQDWAAEIKARHQQQHENAHRRHLGGRAPDFGDSGERVRIIEDQGIPIFSLRAKKFHDVLHNAGAGRDVPGRSVRYSTPHQASEFRPKLGLWLAIRGNDRPAGHHVFAAPTVSAMTAPRMPSGFSGPTVESREVWCSISELSSAPTRTTMVDSHIHIIRPTTAPSAP